MTRRVLVVDDSDGMTRMLADALLEGGFAPLRAVSGAAAIRMLETEAPDAVVTDLRMPGVDGLTVLETSKRLDPQRPVIVMTAYSAVDTAIESIRRGAHHYLTKPFQPDELLLFLRRALEERDLRQSARAMRDALRARFSTTSLVGKSVAMREMLAMVERVAASDVAVLLSGETGTGKSVIARAIHDESARGAGPFVTVNCAALPETLLESELFGHVKGAFTGAASARSGLFVEASRGTLFLDEIGDMAPAVQAKVLHALERGVVRPVGAERESPIDVRVIAATHQDLRVAAAAGRFREDLLFRLDVASIVVPPLRARRDDLPELTTRFLADARAHTPTSVVERFAPDVVERFERYPWPGNVRELKHVVERIVLFGADTTAQLDDLPAHVRTPTPTRPVFHGDVLPIRKMQREYARWALEQLGGARGRTAERLGVDGKTLAKWLEEDEA